ncbi:MAG: alpha/beta hydrolase [Candidatus Dormibacteria bacterium]
MPARTLAAFDPVAVAPWSVGAGPRGALLLHGFAGTPPELRRLGDHLAAHGWRARGPVLAGHGTSPEDLERSTRHDWIASAQAELDRLAAECQEVAVVGQSMGGAIALHLAAVDLRVRAVATLAAPVFLSPLVSLALPVVRRLRRWQYPGTDVDLCDQSAIEELHSHGRRPFSAINEFVRLIAEVREELVQVRAPVLVMHGGGDRTIDPANAAEIARRLVCSREVAQRLYPRSGHGMSVDVDRDDINATVLAWLERHTEAAASLTPGA